MSSAPPSSLPALVFCDPQTAGLKLAALTLLDRLIIALHRGGVSSITLITSAPLPSLKRAAALAIPFQSAPVAPALTGPALMASTNLLVQSADVKRCLQENARLITASGQKLPIGVAPPDPLPSLGLLDSAPEIRAEGVACPVSDPATARAAERALWNSLTSSADGLVDKVFNRPCGRPLSKLLVHTPVTPNAVSVASILVGVLSAFFLATGQYALTVLGAVLFQLSAVIDCVDGDIARAVFKESPLGKWLDLAGDQIVHISVFAGVAFGVVRAGESPQLLWLGASAVLGAVLSFAVVLRGMRCRSGRHNSLQRLIDAATNRDFSVIVLVLALVQQLDWFLWMAAIGSHLFWITALALQLRVRPARQFAQ